MQASRFTIRGLLAAPAAILALLLCSGFAASADEPAKVSPQAWKLDEALEQLALHPRDPYLQYVALQLASRAGRSNDIYQLLQRTNRALFADNGQRASGDLFSTFTGALAVQESLQLDTMRGDPPGGLQVEIDPKKDVAVPPAKQVVPKKAGSVPAAQVDPKAKVSVDKLGGPNLPGHPWEKMLGDKKPDPDLLACCVPDDFWFVQFRSIAKLNDVLGLSELWGGHIFTQALGESKSQATVERIKRQLGMLELPPGAAEALEIDGIAIVGSDLFLSEGSDVTMLVQSRTLPGMLRTLEKFLTLRGAKAVGKYLDIEYTHFTSADGLVNFYSATPRPDLHVRSNSLPALQRVLETIVGKTPDGKPARRLGESAEYRYIRTLMPRGAVEEDGLVYLSDPFIRRLVGAQVKLTERRRLLVYNHLRMIGHAAMLFRTEYGRAPKSLEELAETKCSPGVFGKGRLAHPDEGTYSLSADGMTGICSKYGRVEAMTPLIEHPVKEVSAEEAEMFAAFVREYNQYWRSFFDPIAIRVQASAKQYRLETLILPLIDNSIYTTMAQTMGGERVILDPLPPGKHEIGCLWTHFDKRPLLELLEPREGGIAPKGTDTSALKGPGPRSEFELEANMKLIMLAMQAYHDANGAYPPAALRDKDGKPLLSWRVALLPYLEEQELQQQFDMTEPWDGPKNKKVIAKMPKVFKGLNQKLNDVGKSQFLAPVGKETIFPPDGTAIKVADVTDGTSNTIAAVMANEDAAVIWTKPDDLVVDLKQPLKGLEQEGQIAFLAGMADGATKRIRFRVPPANLAAFFTRAGGEVVPPEPNTVEPFPIPARVLDGLEKELGLDKKKLLRFLSEGIGDQVGLQMHDGSKLFDYDMSGAFGGELGFSAGESFGLGILIQFVTGPSSITLPVKNAKVVDEFLDEMDRMIVRLQAGSYGEIGRVREYMEFYRMPFLEKYTIRCLAIKFAGLKWRLYWGRIGDGFYIANRQFILEDMAEAQSAPKADRKKSEPAHALLRLRPENWKEVMKVYNLGWAEGHRMACHKNLSMLANVNRSWLDAKPKEDEPNVALLNRVFRTYGVRPFCADGGNYLLSADGKSCACSIHGGDRDPRQPQSPTKNSATGRLLQSLGGLSATLSFEDDGLHAIVTIERKE